MQRKLTAHGPCALLALLPLAACASPSHAPLDLTSSEVAWLERGDASTLEQALALAGVGGSSLPVPDPVERQDPGREAYWQACALAWNPGVRAARNELLALREERRSAGAPLPVWARVVDHEFGGDDILLESIAIFDLIGLLGLGPARAARELADVRVVLALATYEEQLWAARLDVERARVQLAASLARAAAIEALAQEAEADLVRIEILERTGRETAIEAEAARARFDALARRRSQLDEGVAVARRVLAACAGLPPRHPALFLGTEGLLESYPERDVPSLAVTTPRVDTHPRLRRARIDFALTEARLREVAAAAWPGIGVSPHLAFRDDTNIGGLVNLTLPWPSSWRGRLAAAEVRREGAREAFEDTWLALELDDRLALERWQFARERAAGPTRALDVSTERIWSAARLQYRVQRLPLMEWSHALQERTNALLQPVDDLEAVALAWIDLLDARGPAALPTALAIAPMPSTRTEPIRNQEVAP